MTIPSLQGPTAREHRSRNSCGHYGPSGGKCDECEDLGGSPDPWLLAEDPGLYERYEETRAYRQSKARIDGDMDLALKARVSRPR